MLDLLFKAMPGQMAKYEYVHRLLRPLREWTRKINVDRPPFPWPLPKAILWSALVRTAEDLKSVDLLERLQQLQAIVEKLESVNKDPGNDAAAMEALMQLTDALPGIDSWIYRHRIASLLKAIGIFVLLGMLIAIRITQCS
ncbi:MAG TPA: hypothetical protein VK639_18590 [Terriglobales bacterium]|nr:hypothetical protein [Terriglobales bacterium]